MKSQALNGLQMLTSINLVLAAPFLTLSHKLQSPELGNEENLIQITYSSFLVFSKSGKLYLSHVIKSNRKLKCLYDYVT
jgi:hypothetical protein